MKLKKFCSLLLVSTMALSSSALVFANTSDKSIENDVVSNTSASDIIISVSDTINEPSILPRDSQRVLLTDLNATDGSQSEFFVIDSLHPAYKVWIDNQSDAKYTVTITQDSPSGSTLSTFYVEAGKQKEVKSITSTYGTRYINVSSKDGVPLSGKVGARVASTYNEL